MHTRVYPECAAKTDTEEKKMLNKVVFFHKHFLVAS